MTGTDHTDVVGRPSGRRMVALAAIVALAGGGASWASMSAADATTPVLPAVQPEAGAEPTSREVAARLDTVLDLHRDTLEMMDVGVAVVDAGGQVVADHAGDHAMLPASTMKALTAAALLDQFGPDDTLVTRVTAATPIDGAGGLGGDLVLVGGGDPTLTTEAFRRHIHPARPATDVEALADQLVAAGLTRVGGNVVGDGTAFGPVTTAAGWPPRYLADYDARRIAGLSLDTGIEVNVAVVDGFEQLVGQQHALDPDLHAAFELARALRERGVSIDGRIERAVTATTESVELATVASPPLHTVIQFMLEESDNHMADTLVRTAGLANEGLGSWSAGARAVEAALVGHDLDPTGVVVDDGSGLSRLDRVAPNTLAQVDAVLTTDYGDQWSSWLSTTGVDGTLENRLLGTSAEGRFHGKTGTLTDVKAIVGHTEGPTGSRLHTAIIANEVPNGQTWRIALLGDDLTLAMTDLLDGCVRTRRPLPTATGGTATPAPTTPGPVPLADLSVWQRDCDAP